MRYFLGIDVGSTKTHALIADETGRCIGFGQAGPGNFQGFGYDGLVTALKESFQQAIQMVDIGASQIAGGGFGIAGYDSISDRPPHLASIAQLGLSCPVEVVNDSVNGLLAGTPEGVGVNITAGSSVNCYGRGPDGQEGRISGNSISFGEFGGGSEIVWKGLHMVNYAWIQRIPPTALTKIYLQATGAKNAQDLIDGLGHQRYYLSPAIAVEVFKAADAGDAAAGEVIRWAGQELGWLVVSVVRQIGMADQPVQVVQSGSVFDGGERLTEPMQQVILQHVPGAQISRLDGPPVVGPVILGMQMAGVDGYTVRQALIQSAKELVQE